MAKTAVVAVGGNSLIKDTAHQTVPDQIMATSVICSHLASMIQQGWRIVATHGNGPQVGMILMRSELSRNTLPEAPLDHCVADTQGSIGYIIQQSLRNELKKRNINNQITTVVTQVLVDKNDPAFENPTKPLGPFYEKEKAMKYKAQLGWQIIEDAGRGWRRVVPSPLPLQIIELNVIKSLVKQGTTVIAVGGGGIPVIMQDNTLHGVEAVIDKDHASALLASSIKTDLLLFSTSVEKVALNYGKANQKWLNKLTLKEAKKYHAEGHFPPGSMGPKIEAAIAYLEKGGKKALITSPENLERALAGKTGTVITT